MDSIVDRFEKDWHKGPQPPNIADYLSMAGVQNKISLLWDLISVDMHHRWKSGQPRSLETYKADHSDLINEDHPFPQSLLKEQLHLMWECRTLPDFDAYIQRYPGVGGVADFWDLVGVDRDHRWKAADYRSLENYLALLSTRHPGNHSIPKSLLIQQFKDEWKYPAPPDIKDYLNQVCKDDRYELLVDLVLVDIKMRGIANAQGIRDRYTKRFPELLNSKGSLPPALIGFQRLSARLNSLKDPNFLLPHYEDLELVGRGSFGVVYKAKDKKLNRLVAIKVFNDATYTDDLKKKRILREARNAAQLTHQHIVQIFSIEEKDDRTPYFICQYIDGCTLTEYSQDPLPFEKSAEFMIKIAHAVGFAHKNHVIHRDLKPSNIMIDDSGEPFITDFGLSRNEKDISISIAGKTIMGTPPFMSPEQATPREHDHRTDIYSLGAILYWLLTGKKPFYGDSLFVVLKKVVEEDPPLPRSINTKIPHSLENICLKAMAKEPERRYASAQELAADLNRFLTGMPTIAQQAGLILRMGLWCRRNRRVAILGSAVILLLTVIAVGSTSTLFFISEARNKAVEAQDRAENEARKAQRHLYISDMTLAKQAWDSGNTKRMHELLDHHLPKDGGHDLRGFDWYYLWRISHVADWVLDSHPYGVSSISYADDGNQFISNGLDGTVKIWDATARKVLTKLKSNSRVNFSSAVALNKKIVACGNGNRITLWNLETQKEMATLHGHKDIVLSLAFSPKGDYLASGSGSADRTIRLWKLSNSGVEQVLGPHNDSILTLQFSPNGTFLVAGGADNHINVWKREKSSEKWQRWNAFEGHSERITSVTFSPDGHFFASGSYDHTIKLWSVKDMRDKAPPPLTILYGHKERIECIDYSPDGRRLASGSINSVIKLWDLDTNSAIATIKGHQAAVRTVKFSPDGNVLLSGGLDGTIRFWDIPYVSRGVEKESILQRDQQGVRHLDFSQDDTILAVGFGGPFHSGEIVLWDVIKGQVLNRRGNSLGGVSSMAFSPDGKIIATGGYDRRVRILHAGNLNQEQTFNTHMGRVTSISFSPDRRTLVTGGYDNMVTIWEFSDNEYSPKVKMSLEQGAKVQCLAYSEDGKCVAVGSHDSITLWRTDSWNSSRILRHHGGSIHCLSFSPDSRFIASGSANATICLWDVVEGKKVAIFQGHTKDVQSLLFSADGATLISASSDETVKFWDVKSGQERMTLNGIGAAIQTLALATNGKTLATGTVDGRVILWHAATEQEVKEYGINTPR